WIAAQPRRHVVVVELFAPQQAGERLAADVAALGVERGGNHGRVELVCLGDALVEDGVEVGTEEASGIGPIAQAELHRGLRPAGAPEAVKSGCLGADPLWIHGVAPAVNQELVKRVLDERSIDVGARKTLEVGLVLREDELGRAPYVEPALPERL